jgi:hypothetical protein
MQPELLAYAHDGSGSVKDLVPAIERMANDIAIRFQVMGREIDTLRKTIRDLLENMGTKGICKGPNCQQEIVFLWHAPTRRLTPYNANGTNHFMTCIDRELFQRRKHGR